MKTVIAIDSFKGSMTSMEAGNAAAAGVKAVFPDAEIVVRPLADRGEGTVEALTTGMGGRMETALVSDRSAGKFQRPTVFWKKIKQR